MNLVQLTFKLPEGCFASTGVCRREWPQKREVHQRGERVKVSNEKNLGWLGYIGDDVLPNYILISQYKDPYKPIRIQWNVIHGFWFTL